MIMIFNILLISFTGDQLIYNLFYSFIITSRLPSDVILQVIVPGMHEADLGDNWKPIAAYQRRCFLGFFTDWGE